MSFTAAVNQIVAQLTTSTSVTGFSLINADSNQVIPGYENFTNGTTLNLATLPTRNLNLVAKTNPATVGSVRFAYDSTTNFSTEVTAPYSFAGDSGTDYGAWTPTTGTHTIKATPYSKTNATGTIGRALSVQFTVIDVAPPTQISTVVLINTDTQKPVANFVFQDGAVIDFDKIGTKNLNILAEPNANEMIAKIQFGYDTKDNYSSQATAPYSFAGDYGVGKLNAWTPTVGNHTLTITPFKQAGSTFISGTPKVIRFSVAAPVASAKIDSLSLYYANSTTIVPGFTSLNSGNTINLGALTSKNINIKANVAADVVQVKFGYDGNANFQTQSQAPFFFAGDGAQGPNAWTPTVGAHSVVATPYKQINGVLVAGTPTTITFTVTDSTTPPVTPPVVSLKPVVTLNATPVITSGGNIRIQWSSTNATGCSASGDWSGNQSATGEVVLSNITTTGTKIFIINCVGNGGTTSLTAQTIVNASLPVDPNITGYTNISPKFDSKVIHVSSSEGNDANSGTIDSPLKTIAKAFSQVRLGYPDQIRLKKGDTWNGMVRNSVNGKVVSGRSNSDKFVLTSYGSGARPIITSSDFGLFFEFNTRNFAVVGIHFKGNNNGNGIGLEGTSNGGGNILIEDCYIERHNKGIVFSSGPLVYTPNDRPVMTNITIRRSVIVDNYKSGGKPQGIYAYGVNGLIIEDNVVDNNGRKLDGSGSTIYDHNMYIHAMNWGVVIRNNIVANASSHGTQVRGGGIVEGNFYYNNPMNMTFGLVRGDGQTFPKGVTGKIINNVMLGTRSIDSGPNAGPRGFGIELANIRSVEISNNIIAYNESTTPIYGAIRFEPGDGAYQNDAVGFHNITIENNTFYKWPVAFELYRVRPSNTAPWRTSSSNIVIRNNKIDGLVPQSSVFTVLQNTTSPSATQTTKPNFDTFIREARKQSKDNWMPSYTAASAISQTKTMMGI
ncbi:MAG: hypothetical protein V4519_04100 [Patescibacteria group bacterium]